MSVSSSVTKLLYYIASFFFSLKHLLASEIFLIIYLWNSVRVGTLCELFSVLSLAPVTLYISGRFTSAISLGLHLISSLLLKFLFVLTYLMAPHSSTLAWKIPWTEEPGRLQSMGSLRVGHDWVTSLSLFTFMHWRRKWQPTPVFLSGESQGWGSLVGCHLWGRTESDTTEAT